MNEATCSVVSVMHTNHVMQVFHIFISLYTCKSHRSIHDAAVDAGDVVRAGEEDVQEKGEHADAHGEEHQHHQKSIQSVDEVVLVA